MRAKSSALSSFFLGWYLERRIIGENLTLALLHQDQYHQAADRENRAITAA
jgi:hypothetical protein